VRTTREKDHQWSSELSHCASELQLHQERVRRLEREVKEKQREVDGLRTELETTQRMHHITQQEVCVCVLEGQGGWVSGWVGVGRGGWVGGWVCMCV